MSGGDRRWPPSGRPPACRHTHSSSPWRGRCLAERSRV